MKVYFDLEQRFIWDPSDRSFYDREPIEIDDHMLAEYREVAQRFWLFQEQFEHMYRHQEKLTPFADSPYANNERTNEKE